MILGVLKASAADSDVVINEVMANAPTPEDKLEWIELYNNGSNPVDLNGWTLDGKTITDPLAVIQSEDFLILARNATEFKLYWTDVTVPVIQVPIVLTNGADKIVLKNQNGTYQEEFEWITDTGDNTSWERIDPTKNGDDNWQLSTSGGSPGNPTKKSTQPNYSEEVLGLINLDNAIIQQVQVYSVVDGDTIKVTGIEGLPSTIRLLFADAPEKGQPFYESANDFTEQLLGKTIDLVISRNADEQIDNPIYNRTLAVVVFDGKVFNTQLLEQGLASFYDIDNSVLNHNAWLGILQQAQLGRIGIWKAAGGITLSELLPDPVGNDAVGEWVEIYNPSDSEVNLSRFVLDQYLIPSGTAIAPKSYLVFLRGQTGVVLNNTSDTIKLFFPGGLVLNETSYSNESDKAIEGLAWAFSAGSWNWTATVTPGEANIITSALENAGGDDEEEGDLPINSTPIEIKTGTFKDYENLLVKITGEVVETSGNTFYIDDGSGKAKVYIQAKTGIEKPEMHKGDIFEVIGIVNLYRDTYRILPQKEEDIKLIKAVEKEAEVASTTKKSTAKLASASTKKSAASTAKARSPTASKNIASAQDQNSDIKVEGMKSPFWIQLIKALIGLAIILLAIIIFKIVRRPKYAKILGGHFGDDET